MQSTIIILHSLWHCQQTASTKAKDTSKLKKKKQILRYSFMLLLIIPTYNVVVHVSIAIDKKKYPATVIDKIKEEADRASLILSR